MRKGARTKKRMTVMKTDLDSMDSSTTEQRKITLKTKIRKVLASSGAVTPTRTILFEVSRKYPYTGGSVDSTIPSAFCLISNLKL